MTQLSRGYLSIWRNTDQDRWKHATLKHFGTVQELYWIGPFFVIRRNRRAARNMAAAHKYRRVTCGS